MSQLRLWFPIIILLTNFTSCISLELHEISVAEFAEFVEATDYKTDAEKFEWSIVQKDVYTFDILYGIDWRCPTGQVEANPNDPVTQISYNDALAYANWIGGRLPSYDEYWKIAKSDRSNINDNGTRIFEIGESNIVGNVWEITTPDVYGRIRLAGGSYLCSEKTCNGTQEERELYVDQITGNSHIGFAIIH